MSTVNINRCQACGGNVGEDYSQKFLVEFRGYWICPACREHWLKLEEVLNQELDFDLFTNPERRNKQLRAEKVKQR